jgi:hypothetical protein
MRLIVLVLASMLVLQGCLGVVYVRPSVEYRAPHYQVPYYRGRTVVERTVVTKRKRAPRHRYKHNRDYKTYRQPYYWGLKYKRDRRGNVRKEKVLKYHEYRDYRY